jgi:hypothetical protein
MSDDRILQQSDNNHALPKSQPTPTQVAFLIPAYNGVLDMGHADMWLRTGATLAMVADRFDLAMFGCGSMNPVAKARNQFMYAALDVGADWLVMIDADTYAETPEAIFDMIQLGIDHGFQVMTGAVMARGPEVGYPLYVRKSDVGTNEFGFRTLTSEEIQGSIIEVDRCGGALLAINLNWIRECWPDGPWFHHPPTDDAGEDWTFCEGVQTRGGVIVADGRFATCHVKGRQVARHNPEVAL